MMAGGKGSTLLEGRNEKCLAVLQQQLAKGSKRLGVYYGAAHFPHMEKRLVADLGFAKVGHEWLVAWDCRKRPDPKFDRALLQQRQLAKQQLGVLVEVAKAVRLARGGDAVPTAQELYDWPIVGESRLWPGEVPAKPRLYDGPVKDPWGQDYVVRKRPIGTRWEAASAGQDKAFGTDDDLVVIEPRAGGLPAGR